MIVLNRHEFKFYKLLKDIVQRWSCSRNSCKSYFKLDATNEMIGKTLNIATKQKAKKFSIDKKSAITQKEEQ